MTWKLKFTLHTQENGGFRRLPNKIIEKYQFVHQIYLNLLYNNEVHISMDEPPQSERDFIIFDLRTNDLFLLGKMLVLAVC